MLLSIWLFTVPGGQRSGCPAPDTECEHRMKFDNEGLQGFIFFIFILVVVILLTLFHSFIRRK